MLTNVMIIAAIALLALSGGSAAAPAAAAPQATGGQPSLPALVIPPATTGLAAAPEELQAALDETILPGTVPELLSELAKRANDIRELISSGALGQVWVPAMGTKTVALVLESRIAPLPERPRAAAAMAIKQIVTSAWDLDTYGDLGNKPKLDEAYRRLASAVLDLKAAYEPR
jgi:hypothetical protein